MRSTPSLGRNLPPPPSVACKFACETVPMFVFIYDGPLSSLQGRSSSASPFQATDGVTSMVVSQAPQHSRSPEVHAVVSDG